MSKKFIVGKGYTQLIEPDDYNAYHKINIALFDSKTIDEIVAECKPHAVGSEFQVHYHSLQAHIRNGAYEVVVTLPLSFYNFDQEVTGGSVSMEMKDVNKEADKCMDINGSKMEEAFAQLPILRHIEGLGFDVSYTVSNNGSIHRHPGDFSFSSIDYDKDPEEPGVIYRQANAKDLYQVDSVIYLGNEEPKFVCTETRIVNVELLENNAGIKGRYTEIPTFSFIKQDVTSNSALYEILGTVKEDNIFESYKITTSMEEELTEHPLLVEILKAFRESEYKPDITNVVGKRITQERIHYGRYNPPWNSTKKKETSLQTSIRESSSNAWGYDDTEGWDDFVDAQVDKGIITDEEDDLHTCMIDGKEMVYNEEWASWLPVSTLQLSEQELIAYLEENDY